jgi:hypothetical protein
VCSRSAARFPPPRAEVAPPAEKSEFDTGTTGEYTRSQTLEAGKFAVYIGGKRIPVSPTNPDQLCGSLTPFLHPIR